MSSNREFIIEFLRTPARVGAVAPSSKDLTKVMLAAIEAEIPALVVEFGPGTGSFTEALIGRLSPQSRLIAIEQSDAFAGILQKRFPDLELVHDSVQALPQILQDRGEAQADCILSGLPWAVFQPEMQREILTAAAASLRPGGTFATFAYVHGLVLPRARRFRRLLETTFSEVRQSEIVWRNLPPAFVYYCRK